jgi:glycosyltransferase involved in cell wall biosynthesis
MVHNDPSGIMPEDMKKILHDESYIFVVLYVGRFDYIKLDYNKLPLVDLIYASNILKTRNMKFHVYYIGGGNEIIRKRMLSLIDEYGLHDYVKLFGVKTNVPDYVQFCHLGVGGVAFNAVSHEFTVNEKPQILVKGLDNEHTPWRHGINAIFVKPDDQEDLAEKLMWAMNHPDELKELGKKAKEDMAEYIIDSKSGGRLYLRAFSDLIESA